MSAADLTRLRSVLADDPTLDDDLTEWHSDVVRRPRIAILGPARITAAGETPNRLNWFTQVGVYLALHRDGVTLEKFAADLWPAPGRPGQARAIATSTRNETAVQGPPVDGHPPGHGCAVRADGHRQVLPAQRPAAGHRAVAAAA